MEFEANANGFVVTVDGECGPTIEWKAKEDEVIILLPARDKYGRPDPGGKIYVTHVKRHTRKGPSVSVYPVYE